MVAEDMCMCSTLPVYTLAHTLTYSFLPAQRVG